MRLPMVSYAGMAFALASISNCASISVTSSRPNEILVCDGTWQQTSMLGHASSKQRAVVYPNPDATKIRVKVSGQIQDVCIKHEGATCKVFIKGKTLIVTSTFPHWLGTQTFIFDTSTAHMTFGDGGLDGGAGFSGTCQRKTD